MADAIRFTFDDSQAQRAIDELGKRATPAIIRALNRTAGSVRTQLSRDIAADISLKVGTVRDELKVRPAREDNLTAAVSVSGSKIPLAKFGATGPMPSRGRGTVSARIGGARKRYPGRFLAQMRSGHIGVFGRIAPSTRRSAGAWGKNLPIAELFGPSLPHVFEKHLPAGIARGEEQLVKNLEHEIGFALSQAGQ